MKVGFQGVEGAYSHMALNSYFGDRVDAIGFESSEQVCEALTQGDLDHAIFPVENSIVGNVTVNLDLLYQNDFFSYGELYFPIRHCLLVAPGTKLSQIKAAHSHPVALSQCRDFLNKHGIKSIPDFDTAGAAKTLVNKNIHSEATIASELCAKLYNLEVLDRSIQKHENNLTRFLVFTKKYNVPNEIVYEKSSIALALNHRPGALLDCLKSFSTHGINLTKIESRPIPSNPFKYIFFIDFEGSIASENTKECFREIEKLTSLLKILGCYPKGKIAKS